MAARLTDREKEAIVDLWKTNKYTILEIAGLTGRSESVINKTIDKFKEDNPEVEREDKEKSFERGRKFISQKMIDNAVYKLYQSGIPQSDAEKAVNSVIPFLQETVKNLDDFIQFVQEVANGNDLGRKTTDGGGRGVFVMTEPLAARGDLARMMPKKVDTTNIFNPNG